MSEATVVASRLRGFPCLRFANSNLEPGWNREHVECVRITLAESFGVEDRGHFYDPVGALAPLVVELDPSTGVGPLSAGSQVPAAISLDMEFAEEAWRVMQPLLDAPPPVHAYAPGSWVPAAADDLFAGHGRWHEPSVAS